MIRLSGHSLTLVPPFSDMASLLQALVPILALGGGASGHVIALLPILRLELLCGFLPRPIRIQT